MGEKGLRTTVALPSKFLFKSHPCRPAAASAWLSSHHHIVFPLPDVLIAPMLRAALRRSNAHTVLLGWGFLGCLSVFQHCRSSAKVPGPCRLCVGIPGPQQAQQPSSCRQVGFQCSIHQTGNVFKANHEVLLANNTVTKMTGNRSQRATRRVLCKRNYKGNLKENSCSDPRIRIEQEAANDTSSLDCTIK